MWEALLQMQKLPIFFFSKTFSIYVIFNDQSFNDALTNGIIWFEQMGRGGKAKKHIEYTFYIGLLTKYGNIQCSVVFPLYTEMRYYKLRLTKENGVLSLVSLDNIIVVFNIFLFVCSFYCCSCCCSFCLYFLLFICWCCCLCFFLYFLCLFVYALFVWSYF